MMNHNSKAGVMFSAHSFTLHFSLASFLWDIGKQYSPRCDAAERGVPSVAIVFAYRNFNEKWNTGSILKSLLIHLKMKVDSSK